MTLSSGQIISYCDSPIVICNRNFERLSTFIAVDTISFQQDGLPAVPETTRRTGEYQEVHGIEEARWRVRGKN